MKKIISFFLILSIVVSCKQKHAGEQTTGLLSNFVSITNNEDKGIKEILSAYGGECEYSVGKNISSEEKSKEFFEIKLSKSNAVEKYSQIVEMPASNIAYLFYKNLKEEKNKYNEIHVVVILNGGEKKEFSYSMNDLETVHAKLPLVDTIVNIIKNKDFEKLSSYIDNGELNNTEIKEIISKMNEVEKNLPTIKQFVLYGFQIGKVESGDTFLRLSGAIIREQSGNEFSVELNVNSKENKISNITYKL